MIVAIDDDGGMEQEEGYGGAAMSMSSELELCVARIRELRAELEFERRMRRKAESLNEVLAVELAEERRRSGAAEAEAECQRMREEVDAMCAEMEHALEEIDEERRMLHVAELWREERVQMKLADAKAAVQERLQEIADGGLNAAVADGNKSSSSSPISKSSPTSQHGQQSPTSGQHSQLHRREASGGQNPHIRRGIKGFVEFPRAVRVRPREERVDLVSNLECQRAQLRVLMRHRNPAAGMGLVGASENLVL